MKITKVGHSCMVVEEGSVKIMIDPGTYSTGQTEVKNLDAVLITHEHPDHFDISSLRTVLQNNPKCGIYTSGGVGERLKSEGIAFQILLSGHEIKISGIPVKGVGAKHAEIYKTYPIVDNVGYLIGRRFFYPGDALTVPKEKIEILALPVSAPWMRLSEAIDYALAVSPRVCFPVHDGMLKPIPNMPNHRLPQLILEPQGIAFKVLQEGKEYAF